MMKKKLNNYGGSSSSRTREEEKSEWEMRPGGMLVQKRTGTPDTPVALRLRIAYGALRYDIYVSSMATFGEVKKVMSDETGLKVEEQRVIYRGKERENGEYLDVCGVKDRSKLVLIQDASSIERRYIQMRINAKIKTANRSINNVSLELDQLTDQVSAIEKSISNGVKVPEVQIITLIEMLMRQAIKLESISAEGDAASQKILQGKRVQKSVETLDLLKTSNATIKPVVVTTKWESF
ncbi:BAG family molecular chaperone regulator 3-like [Trifolium pratense]|uniref:BAG family molecular chaperone regulator 3-like n=1 Tax=Trifolium pratense TaxID=57577 RepID=UPI001E694B05|nr:BAG family molecular chaperone regulator 3-like [Trifolium pratense]